MVTAVVCAAFHAATDAAVLAARGLVRAAGVNVPQQPRHRPHVSLAAARVMQGDELDRLVTVAAAVAHSHEPFELVLDDVGSFTRAGVLWLRPAPSPRLTRLQGAVAIALAEAGWPPAFGERSDPAAWVPHCTLATRLPKRLCEVQAAVRTQFRPIQGRVDALATILVGGHSDVGHARLYVPVP
jgi:2'-5' RNA ligase